MTVVGTINQLNVNGIISPLYIYGTISQGGSLVSSWTDAVYILTSGDTWYKREISSTTFTLSYSSDGGDTYTELMELDITEDSAIIDLTHQYVHSIVGTSYQVATTGGEILYST